MRASPGPVHSFFSFPLSQSVFLASLFFFSRSHGIGARIFDLSVSISCSRFRSSRHVLQRSFCSPTPSLHPLFPQLGRGSPPHRPSLFRASVPTTSPLSLPLLTSRDATRSAVPPARSYRALAPPAPLLLSFLFPSQCCSSHLPICSAGFSQYHVLFFPTGLLFLPFMIASPSAPHRGAPSPFSPPFIVSSPLLSSVFSPLLALHCCCVVCSCVDCCWLWISRASPPLWRHRRRRRVGRVFAFLSLPLARVPSFTASFRSAVFVCFVCLPLLLLAGCSRLNEDC